MNNKIRQGFEDMAPDIFAQIKAAPYEIIQSEEELFSELIPKKVVKPKKKMWYSVTSLAAAAAIMLCIMSGTVGHVDAAVGEIYLDADASIILEVDENNQIIDIKAGNEDAEGIVDEMVKNTNFPANIGDVVDKAITGLNENGHESKDILVSYCYDDKKVDAVENEVASSADECTVQSFQKDEQAVKDAQKRKISMALRHFEKSAGRDVILTAEKKEEIATKVVAQKTNVEATTGATPAVKKVTKRRWRTSESEVQEEPQVTEEQVVENPNKDIVNKIKERQQKFSSKERYETDATEE